MINVKNCFMGTASGCFQKEPARFVQGLWPWSPSRAVPRGGCGTALLPCPCSTDRVPRGHGEDGRVQRNTLKLCWGRGCWGCSGTSSPWGSSRGWAAGGCPGTPNRYTGHHPPGAPRSPLPRPRCCPGSAAGAAAQHRPAPLLLPSPLLRLPVINNVFTKGIFLALGNNRNHIGCISTKIQVTWGIKQRCN